MKAMLKTPTLLLLALTILFSVQASARGGGTDGGSNGVRMGGGDRLILLDLFVDNVAFVDDHREPEKRALVVKNAPKLRSSAALPDFIARPQEQAAYQYAQAKLSAWNKSSVVVRYVRESMTSMYFWVQDKVPPTSGYVIPENVARAYPQLQVESIAFYSDEMHGAVLSPVQWKRLGLISQAGVLIHEALRHIQNRDHRIFGKQQSLPQMQDKTLQDLTAKILKGPRSVNDDLDSMQGIGTSLEFVREFHFPQTRENALSEICGDMKRFEALTLENLRKYMPEKQTRHTPLNLRSLCQSEVAFYNEPLRFLYILAMFNAAYVKPNYGLLKELAVPMMSSAGKDERKTFMTLLQSTFHKAEKFAMDSIFTSNMDDSLDRELFQLKNRLGEVP